MHEGEYELKCGSNGGPRPRHLWWFNGKRVDLMKAEEREELNIIEDKSQKTSWRDYSGILKLNFLTDKNVGCYSREPFQCFPDKQWRQSRFKIADE